MADESAEWRVTVRWPCTPVVKGRNDSLLWYLEDPERVRSAAWDIAWVRAESFDVGPRTVRFVAVATGVTYRPGIGASRNVTQFQSGAQGAVDAVIRAACFLAELARLAPRGEGLPEPVRFEVRPA
jgi:hypothetical protein